MPSEPDDTDIAEAKPIYKYLKDIEILFSGAMVALAIWAVWIPISRGFTGISIFGGLIIISIPGTVLSLIYIQASSRREDDRTDW